MQLTTRILLWVTFGMVVMLGISIPLLTAMTEPAIVAEHAGMLSGLGPLLNRVVQQQPALLDQPQQLRELVRLPVEVLAREQLPAQVQEDLRAASQTHRQTDQLRMFFAIEGQWRVVVVGPLPAADYHIGLLTMVVLGLSLIVSFVITLLVVRPILKRLQALRLTAERLSRGELDARAEDDSDDALGTVARAFNEMGERVQAMIKGQRHLLQAVSHEFRTPASRMRFELELLRGKTRPAARERKILAIEDSLDDLDQLVSELMEVVRFDTGAPSLIRQHVRVASEAEAALGRHRHLRADVVLLHDIAADLVISASPKHFRRVLDNLISNAVRHASSRVLLRAIEQGAAVTLSVQDDGAGIDEADRERIFEPFARLDGSRSRDYGGAGLGLTLVRRILSWHNGTITVERAESGGADFRTSWRRAPSSETLGGERSCHES